MRQLPWAKELFDVQEDAFDDSKSKNRSSGGYHTAGNKKSELNQIDERSLEGSDDNDEGDTIEETKDQVKMPKDDKFFYQEEETKDFANHSKGENREKSKLKMNHKSKTDMNEEAEDKFAMRMSSGSKQSKMKKGGNKLGNKNSYFRTSYNSSSHFEGEETEFVDQTTLKKLGLLKDEDFLRIHK